VPNHTWGSGLGETGDHYFFPGIRFVMTTLGKLGGFLCAPINSTGGALTKAVGGGRHPHLILGTWWGGGGGIPGGPPSVGGGAGFGLRGLGAVTRVAIRGGAGRH